MGNQYDPITYKVDPHFDLDAHQKRYCWRGFDVPRINKAKDAEKQQVNDSIELAAAA